MSWLYADKGFKLNIDISIICLSSLYVSHVTDRPSTPVLPHCDAMIPTALTSTIWHPLHFCFQGYGFIRQDNPGVVRVWRLPMCAHHWMSFGGGDLSRAWWGPCYQWICWQVSHPSTHTYNLYQNNWYLLFWSVP